MPTAPKVPHEAQRLAALRAARLLDTPAELAFDDLVHVASAICGVDLAAITLIDEARQWFKATYGFEGVETPLDESFCAYTILEPHSVLEVHDAQADARFVDNPAVTGGLGVRFYAGVPLLDAEGMALGTLCVFDTKPGSLNQVQVSAMRALGRQFSHLLELRRTTAALEREMIERQWYEQQLAEYSRQLELQNADLSAQTRTDPLTGLHNRRAFSVALEAAAERAGREQTPLSVALLDLDHFKIINDVHGHAAGDRVLAEVATVLKAHVAAAGMAARWGGEEFAVLLPDVGLDLARLQCEFLRQAISDLPLGVVVTTSIGVAQWRPGEEPPAAIERADMALYRAKAGGRDRVETEPA